MEKKLNLKTEEIIIFIAGVFVRVFSLGTIPSGVYIDEPPISYSAWCIANFGVDRYLRHFPVYFQNWYSGQSPMYTYFLAFLYRVGFPMGNPGVIRIPACIFSILILVIVFFAVREFTEDTEAQVFALFAAAFCPFFIMQGRIGLDCNLLLFWSILSLFLLVRFIKSGKINDLVICGICFGLSLYTYALSYILMGIFLVLAALYLLWTGKIDIKKTLLWALTVAVVSLPIILFALSVIFGIDEYSILGITVAPVSAGRLSELSGSNFIKNAILSIFKSLTFDNHYAMTLKEFGTLYYISVPFVLAGMVLGFVNMVKSIIKREFSFDAVFVLFLISNAVVGGLNREVLVYRINAVFAAYLYFLVKAVYGFFVLFKKEKVKKGVISATALLYLACTVVFVKYYFTDYAIDNDGFIHSAKEAVDYWQENYNGADLYVDYYGLPELVLYEYPISPYEWSEAERVLNIIPRIPEVIQGDCGYIIRKTNGSDKELIENSGVEFGYEDFGYYILYYPLF